MLTKFFNEIFSHFLHSLCRSVLGIICVLLGRVAVCLNDFNIFSKDKAIV